jgi:hypothetical protein
MVVPKVRVTDDVTPVGAIWRYALPLSGGTTVEVVVVVEFLAKLVPILVPDPPLHLPDDQTTAQA